MCLEQACPPSISISPAYASLYISPHTENLSASIGWSLNIRIILSITYKIPLNKIVRLKTNGTLKNESKSIKLIVKRTKHVPGSEEEDVQHFDPLIVVRRLMPYAQLFLLVCGFHVPMTNDDYSICHSFSAHKKKKNQSRELKLRTLTD